MDRKHLAVLATHGVKDDPPDPTTLPTREQASYVGPMSSGERRNCSNCWKWVGPSDRCIEHGPTLPVYSDDVCSLHTPGVPLTAWPPMIDELAVEFYTTKESGLVNAPDGTACDNCKNGHAGTCWAVQDAGELLQVESRACCNMWDPADGSKAPKP